MKTRAAVAREAGKPLTIETVELDGPKAGECLVEIKSTGICHTDEFTRSGADPEGLFPAILGHEGAGIIVDVGPGVTSLKKGDHVIPLYTPECRHCEYCLSQKTNLCQAIRSTQGKGVMPDGTSRFKVGGQDVFHYMGTSTFSNHTVVPEIALAKIREDAPFEKVCYIGCGVTTGIGAVINTAKVEPGANCVVFGLGGIGLNVVQGLRMVGANRIVGVDTNPGKEKLAREFGMTHFVNPKEVRGDLVPYLVDLTKGGADYSFECIGNVDVMRQALECCHKGWGESIIIGVAGAGQEIATRPFQLVTGRSWRGTAFGGARGRTDVPKIVDWYMEGKIRIDEMITHTLSLDSINEGFDLMHAGKSIRAVVNFDMAALETLAEHRCFGGVQGFYRHASREIGLPMKLSVFRPPQAALGPVPVLFYLAGLTCTEETFMLKAGAQRLAAELGIMLVAPDTSPRGAGCPGEDDDWDFGSGAGFYLDATKEPWSKHYRMYSYVTEELRELATKELPGRADRLGIFGHSMGGHGALVCALKNPAQYRSVSAFAPVAAPMQCPWGEKAFSNYLGDDRSEWEAWDASALVQNAERDASSLAASILIDQGTDDKFLENQLNPDVFEVACRARGQALTLRRQPGYNHGYFFIATFVEDHLRHHAERLAG